MTAPAMLIDALLPGYDAVRAEHRIVAGEVDAAYAAVMRADSMRAWRESPVVRFLFAARGLGERAVSAAARQPLASRRRPSPCACATSRRTAIGSCSARIAARGRVRRDRPLLGRRDGLGADRRGRVCRIRRPRLRQARLQLLAAAGRRRRTLVSYECRTQATDAAARAGFLRYWRPLSPFVGVVLRAQLGVVADEVRR